MVQRSFFDFFATFTKPWSRKNFSHIFATFTKPWSREKTFFWFCYHVHYAMIKRKKSFFHLSHYFHYVIVTGKRNLIFITPLLWLCYDHKKKHFFHFTTTFTMQISSYIILHQPATPTTSLTCWKNDIFPIKICVTLKTFFLRNFGGVLDDSISHI